MATVTMNRPSTTNGTRMLMVTVKSPSMNSQPGGMRRSAPSANPMYQSGWVPAETGEGSYGPYTHTALIEKNEAMATITPQTRKKNPPALAAKIGMIATPTTLSLV